jgi:hypothetical protein
MIEKRRKKHDNLVFNLHFMKVNTENDNNFGYEKNYDFGRQYAFNIQYKQIILS